MATTSRYPSSAGATPALDPNTSVRTGSSSTTSTQGSSQSQYTGLTSAGLANLNVIVDKLLYGSNPTKQKVYTDDKGNVVDVSAQENQLVPVPGVPGAFTDGSGRVKGMIRQSIQTTPSADSILNSNPDQAQAVSDLRNILSAYSPDAAQGDATNAVNYAIQKAMEQNMPAIARSVENAGTSGGSMEALLSQDLAARAGGEAALLGLKQKADYGNISAQLGSVLANLSSQKDPRLQQLIDAMGLGQVSSGSSSSSSSTTTNSQDNTSPLALTNPELFLPQPSTGTRRTSSSAATGTSTGTSSSSGASGSGFISGPNSLTTFGNTNTSQANALLRSLGGA